MAGFSWPTLCYCTWMEEQCIFTHFHCRLWLIYIRKLIIENSERESFCFPRSPPTYRAQSWLDFLLIFPLSFSASNRYFYLLHSDALELNAFRILLSHK